jgi:transcriptional regulator with XRE-family HTH domain
MTNRISRNVRYLLWRKGVNRAQWETWLTSHTSMDVVTVRSLVAGTLNDGQMPARDVRKLAHAFELGDEDDNLRFADFVSDGCNILAENLKYLSESLGHGGKKSLAAKLDVNPTTVSRWLNGSSQPPQSTLLQIATYFGMKLDTNLQEDPVFLSSQPAGLVERRRWLHTRLEALSAEDLRDLYPALRRLLEER